MRGLYLSMKIDYLMSFLTIQLAPAPHTHPPCGLPLQANMRGLYLSMKIDYLMSFLIIHPAWRAISFLLRLVGGTASLTFWLTEIRVSAYWGAAASGKASLHAGVHAGTGTGEDDLTENTPLLLAVGFLTSNTTRLACRLVCLWLAEKTEFPYLLRLPFRVPPRDVPVHLQAHFWHAPPPQLRIPVRTELPEGAFPEAYDAEAEAEREAQVHAPL